MARVAFAALSSSTSVLDRLLKTPGLDTGREAEGATLGLLSV